jgi:large subunit ribosomal protein L9
MEIVLLQNVKDLGRKGEVKNVKEGYFLNFLAPRALAKKANADDVKNMKSRIEKQIIEKEQLELQAKQVKDKLEGLEIVIKGKAKGNNLYAAITAEALIDAILEKVKIRLSKENLPPKMHLKEVGEQQIELKLAGGLKASLKLKIEGTPV